MLAVGPLGPQYCWIFAWNELGRHAHLRRRHPPCHSCTDSHWQWNCSTHWDCPPRWMADSPTRLSAIRRLHRCAQQSCWCDCSGICSRWINELVYSVVSITSQLHYSSAENPSSSNLQILCNNFVESCPMSMLKIWVSDVFKVWINHYFTTNY